MPLLPSVTVASATASVGSGAVSSLVMVPIAVPSAMVAPLGDDRVSVRVSLALDRGVARHLDVHDLGGLAGGEGERAGSAPCSRCRRVAVPLLVA